MKIYIKNYNPTNIFEKLKLLDDYYVNTKKSIEIISDEGVFYINDSKIYKMSIISDKLSELKNNNIELLLDKTLYNNIVVHQLPLNHTPCHLTKSRLITLLVTSKLLIPAFHFAGSIHMCQWWCRFTRLVQY